MSRRKKYSKEFKLDAVSLVLDQNYSRAEAAIRRQQGGYTGTISVNNAGEGSASGPSNPVTPQGVVIEDDMFSSGFEAPEN